MRLDTFKYKVIRLLRRKGEAYCPMLFFPYRSGPAPSDMRFKNWLETVPFDSSIVLKERIPDLQQKKLISKADALCENIFDLLGSGPYQFRGGIDWHLDFKSGYRWPEECVYSRCRPQAGADIKVPWELSRFNHAVTLGLAYQLSGTRKYIDVFCSQVKAWIASNPVGFGVNWACPMDVAIRAVNWLVGIALFSDSFHLEEFLQFREKITRSLWHHARFIYLHLEWGGPGTHGGGNHFLSDLAGLLTVGLFFRDEASGRRWLDFACDRLEEQMTQQVFSDGVHFECSPSYHRLCLEMFMWCGALARNAGRPLSDTYYRRLRRMQQFTADYSSPNGFAPLIGDNDDGRLLASGLQDLNDHRYLLPEGESGSFLIDRYLLDGTEFVAPADEGQSAAYPDGGFYFLQNGSARLIIRAGKLGHVGAHSHNDQLSFELRLNGCAVIVDRGAYIYTPEPNERNRYRATSAHNTVQINGSEQNIIGTAIFGLPDQTKTRVIEQKRNTLTAAHRGFNDLQRPELEVKRKYTLESDSLEIEDTLIAIEQGDELRWAFHLAPGWSAAVKGSEVTLHDKNSKQSVSLILRFPSAAIDVDEFAHSPSYGVLNHAETIRVKIVADDRMPENYQIVLKWSQP